MKTKVLIIIVVYAPQGKYAGDDKNRFFRIYISGYAGVHILR